MHIFPLLIFFYYRWLTAIGPYLCPWLSVVSVLYHLVFHYLPVDKYCWETMMANRMQWEMCRWFALTKVEACFMVCSGLLWVFMDCILHKKCDYDFWRPNLKKVVCGWLAYDKKPVSLLENTKSMQKWQRNDNKRQTVALQIQNKPVSAFESLFCIIHDFILCYPPWSGASIGVWMTLEASWNVSGELCIIGFRSYAL